MDKPKFLLVDTDVLPDVFLKVVYAKKMIAQGKAKSSSEAAKLAGISRSAFYKYKDCVQQYNSKMSDNIVTIYATLADEPGVLSSVISQLYTSGANILTLNQNIPVDSVAHVSISAKINSINCTEQELIMQIKGLTGVVEAKLLSGS
ncbi:chorismate mutase [Hydrogenoanaerobacterium saccharovorans]|uniref:Chorismate mutase n=1 Tax=Hydrogenoanaerobacterium saccharovorans TaxID=474960 RepID=A0A1H8AF96_9FIRM|nr:ACT domain-containing protein [Hydrogenoanaerobacterium saccharovorans]RPF48018.1 chorismate mutase [Hydrogenoanaerobacterium saccharovorans]SEM68508.1 chorismate mutase [Hydrogenoanaerobacterium saccharovorans]